MIDAIRKKFFSGEKGSEMKEKPAQASTPAVDTNMAAELKQAQDALTSQAADMQALTELVQELSTKFEQAQAALNASEAAKAALVAEAATKRLATRKEAIVAAVGTDKAETLMAATETLDDAQFNAVVGAMAASFEAEAKSKMFTEAGVSAEAKQPVDAETDTAKKLAAAIQAELNPTK